MLLDAGERVPPDDDFNDIRCDLYAIRDHLKLTL
jgi:hypothetical protein